MSIEREGARCRFFLFRSLALAALILAVGCSGSTEKIVPVVGKVTVAGKPLTIGSVSFRPDASKGNTTRHHPTGVINSEGRYQLYSGRQTGAPLGWYKVLVFADENQAQGKVHPVMPRYATHVKYTLETKTDLSVEVVEKPAPGAYDLSLKK
jgi:hypothetical protein